MIFHRRLRPAGTTDHDGTCMDKRLFAVAGMTGPTCCLGVYLAKKKRMKEKNTRKSPREKKGIEENL
jgi:hypothetical protein